MANQKWVVHSGEDVGRAIADIRHRRGLSQSELSELASLDPAYLSKIERGRSVSLLEHQLRTLRRLGATVTITLDD